MNEVTRIITVEITMIDKCQDLKDLKSKEQYKERFEQALKRDTGADDVVVTNIQDFIMDK